MTLPQFKSPAKQIQAGRTAAKRRGDPAYARFRLQNSPLYLLVRTADRYAHEMENALRLSGIDLMSWRALMILNEINPRSVSELAEQSVTRLSTMTRVVQRLDKKRLVTLSKRPTDTRVTEVYITSVGRRCVARFSGTASTIYQRATLNLSSADILLLMRLLRRIYTNFSR